MAYVWGLHQQDVGLTQLADTTEMLCFAAKWLGKRGVLFFSEYHHGREVMVQQAHRLLAEADVVMHYNGKSFDVPHLNREFLSHGLTPPSPFKQIDLYTTVRSRFRFPSNKLEYVSKALGLSGKVKHEGFELWLKVMAGDEQAWKRFERYNRRDVTLLEELYELLRPWVPSHPNAALFTGDGDTCPACGSSELVWEGWAYTAAGRYRRFHCKPCGKWSRSAKRDGATTNIREVPL